MRKCLAEISLTSPLFCYSFVAVFSAFPLSTCNMAEPSSGDQVDYEAGEEKHHATVIEDQLAPSGDGTFTTRQYAIKHRLDRYLGFLPIIALVSTLQASWESIAGGLLGGLYNGGPVGLVYGFIVAYFGTLALAASFAEMARKEKG